MAFQLKKILFACRGFILQIKPLTIFVTSIKYKQVIILLKHGIDNFTV